jgi:phospholipase C
MGYYTRADLPFHYTLADAFTICDNYHCSVFGPTNRNRLYLWTASIDPAGCGRRRRRSRRRDARPRGSRQVPPRPG